ncbi:glycosyltransferase family 2 protein [Crocinitomix catalasitica]|uniref:glycosyltransferase family 2 protein n=1 Tax=Crocinitomix catalasitica TaxID=184607 RepID=UPI0004803ABB|nr:glycosyltransferase family 2 protein [Crocinitomix catalasitica]
MDKIAVVILNYNGRSFLEKFLPSVIEYSQNAIIYVADNNSTDDSVTFIKDKYPNIKLVINESNGGFAKGYNDALKVIKAEYYVLLNSDIEVSPNWISPCLELLESDKKIVAVQPKVLAYHDKTKFEHAGAAGGFLDKDFYPFCRGRIFGDTEVDNGQYNSNREVFWATGACLFIEAEKYWAAGGLDEDFFAHMEEIDLCWRLKGLGYSIYACCDSTVYHVGGGTLNYMNPRKTYLNFRNSLYMITKNYDGWLFGKIFKRLILDGFAGILFISKLQFRHCIALIKAHFHFYGKLSHILKKRKDIKQSKGIFNEKGLYKKNIVFTSFIQRKHTFSELKPNDFK